MDSDQDIHIDSDLVADGDAPMDTPGTPDALPDRPYDIGTDSDATGDADSSSCRGGIAFVGAKVLSTPGLALNIPLVAADFDNDGNPDLLFVGSTNKFGVLLGKGDGTIRDVLPYTDNPDAGQGGWFVVATAIGDWNRDGKVDVAVSEVALASTGGTTNIRTAVLLGDGAGGFGTRRSYPIGLAVGPGAGKVIAGDWNGDGAPDLAVTTNASLTVLVGRGDGTFTVGAMNPIPSDIPSLATADWNGDNKPDIAVATFSGSESGVYILFGNGDGTFQTAVKKYPSGYVVSAADLNRDGKVDLAVGSKVSDASVSILLANGDGTFQTATNYSTDGVFPDSVVTADLNRDGRVDLVAAGWTSELHPGHRTVSVRLGNGDGTFKSASGYYLGMRNFPVANPESSPLSAVDFNRDGNLDLVTVTTSDGVSLLTGNGDGTFRSARDYQAHSAQVSAGDWNKDGKLDLSVANLLPPVASPTSNVSIYLGGGDGSLSSPVDYPVEPSPPTGSPCAIAGDWNGDGNVDLAFASVGPAVGVLLGNGDGSFQKVDPYSNSLGPIVDFAAADVNGDGNTDLVTANGQARSFSVMPGDGKGKFASQGGYTTGYLSTGYASAVIVGDWNGDGYADVAVADRDNGMIGVRLNRGTGFFAPSVDYSSGTQTLSLATADWNGDGKADLAAANFDDTFVAIFLGNGDGTFQARVSLSVGSPSRSVIAADFDGDGKSDLAVTTLNRPDGSGVLAIFAGKGDGTFANPVVLDAGLTPNSMAAGDWNGDGRIDVAVTDHLDDRFILLIGKCP